MTPDHAPWGMEVGGQGEGMNKGKMNHQTDQRAQSIPLFPGPRALVAIPASRATE